MAGLDCQFYLIEAKWQAQRTGNSDLLTFAGKVARKAEWSRCLFVSYSRFTEEGLAAFAQGKQTNIVCMDGLDLFEVISKKLDLRDVIRRKVASGPLPTGQGSLASHRYDEAWLVSGVG